MRFVKRNARPWLDKERNYELSDQENAVIGLALFLFIVLWVAVGPPRSP